MIIALLSRCPHESYVLTQETQKAGDVKSAEQTGVIKGIESAKVNLALYCMCALEESALAKRFFNW